MGFLGIGAMEALVILVIALIIFGPGRLPEIMGEAGRAVRDFRRATQELTGDFQESISEVRGTYEELEGEMRRTASDLQRDAQTMADDVNKAVNEASTLDDGSKDAPRRRRTPTRLDQVEESEARPLPAQSQPTPQRQSKSQARQTVASASTANGSVAATDDLLAIEDGDDLLAADDSD